MQSKKKRKIRPRNIVVNRVIAVTAPPNFSEMIKNDPAGPEVQAFLNQMLDEHLAGVPNPNRVELFNGDESGERKILRVPSNDTKRKPAKAKRAPASKPNARKSIVRQKTRQGRKPK